MFKPFFFIIVFSALFINNACESDDLDDSITNPITLNSSWNLTSIEGGFAGVHYQFEEDLITWAFNESTNVLTVVNNNLEDVVYDGLESGEYMYSIIAFDDILLLEIDNEIFGSYFIEDDYLTIDQNGSTSGNSDGFILGFDR